MPIHWNARFQIDGTSSKPWGPFILPIVMVALHALFAVVRRIAPRGSSVRSFEGALDSVRVATVAFFFLVDVAALSAALGGPVSMRRAVIAGSGLLFVVIGNVMGKFTRNFFAGIRTPWTLASDEVWLRTHRLGGRLWVLGGLVLVASGLLGGGVVSLFVVLALVAGIPMIYSYVIYRRLEGGKD